MLLRDIAHARTGDKGNKSIISVVVYRLSDYPIIECLLTEAKVRQVYRGIVRGDVKRFALPHLGALNFVLDDALGGGVTRSLALDAHGKCLSSALLGVPVAPAVRAQFSDMEGENDHTHMD